MRGHHLWRDVSELNKPREFRSVEREARGRAGGGRGNEGEEVVESEAARTTGNPHTRR